MASGSPELSVVLPFADHEEVLGEACRRVVHHLRELGIDFEVLAIDEGSGDNSRALLSLVRGTLPELRVVQAGPHRGYTVGATQARGRVLLLIEPDAALRSLAPLAGAIERVSRGADLVLLPARFAVAKRTRALTVLDPVRLRGVDFARTLARRAERRGLAVEVWPGAAPARPTRVWHRFAAALAALAVR